MDPTEFIDLVDSERDHGLGAKGQAPDFLDITKTPPDPYESDEERLARLRKRRLRLDWEIGQTPHK